MTAQPKKTKEERLEELRQLWVSPAGQDEVWDLFFAATDLPAGTMPPAGTPVFQTILDKEYPNG